MNVRVMLIFAILITCLVFYTRMVFMSGYYDSWKYEGKTAIERMEERR